VSAFCRAMSHGPTAATAADCSWQLYNTRRSCAVHARQYAKKPRHSLPSRHVQHLVLHHHSGAMQQQSTTRACAMQYLCPASMCRSLTCTQHQSTTPACVMHCRVVLSSCKHVPSQISHAVMLTCKHVSCLCRCLVVCIQSQADHDSRIATSALAHPFPHHMTCTVRTSFPLLTPHAHASH
jgi:hypothetical protein